MTALFANGHICIRSKHISKHIAIGHVHKPIDARRTAWLKFTGTSGD